MAKYPKINGEVIYLVYNIKIMLNGYGICLKYQKKIKNICPYRKK